jgi:transposase
MGNRYIRRLLNLGAMAQIMLRRRLKREPGSDWLSGMLMRKKTKVVAIALAHRMARMIFCRPQGRVSIRAAGGLTALGMVRAT